MAAEIAGTHSEGQQSGADTFLALSMIIVSCISGIVLGLYWRVLVLDNLISMDAASMSNTLLFVLYAPVAIVAVIMGFGWFYFTYRVFKFLGVKTKDIDGLLK